MSPESAAPPQESHHALPVEESSQPASPVVAKARANALRMVVYGGLAFIVGTVALPSILALALKGGMSDPEARLNRLGAPVRAESLYPPLTPGSSDSAPEVREIVATLRRDSLSAAQEDRVIALMDQAVRDNRFLPHYETTDGRLNFTPATYYNSVTELIRRRAIALRGEGRRVEAVRLVRLLDDWGVLIAQDPYLASLKMSASCRDTAERLARDMLQADGSAEMAYALEDFFKHRQPTVNFRNALRGTAYEIEALMKSDATMKEALAAMATSDHLPSRIASHIASRFSVDTVRQNFRDVTLSRLADALTVVDELKSDENTVANRDAYRVASRELQDMFNDWSASEAVQDRFAAQYLPIHEMRVFLNLQRASHAKTYAEAIRIAAERHRTGRWPPSWLAYLYFLPDGNGFIIEDRPFDTDRNSTAQTSAVVRYALPGYTIANPYAMVGFTERGERSRGFFPARPILDSGNRRA